MQENKPINIEDKVMGEILEGKAKMKPKWMFLLGSAVFSFGIFALVVVLLFLFNLMAFSLRSHGPMGEIRFDQIVSGFPWWAVVVAVIGVALGAMMLRRYNFSYKRNFVFILAVSLIGIFLLGIVSDYAGVDRAWRERPMMRRMYERYDGGRGVRGMRNFERNLPPFATSSFEKSF
jgi:hypothetical protein